MIIKNDQNVVVYINTQSKYLRSVYSKFEGMVQEYKTVAYIEDYGVLCYGLDTYFYSMDKYIDDVMRGEFIEMTYGEYILKHRDSLAVTFPDAPVLVSAPSTVTENTPQIQFGNSEPLPLINKFGQTDVTKQVLLDNNPVLADLNRNGIKVQILRG